MLCTKILFYFLYQICLQFNQADLKGTLLHQTKFSH